MKIFISCSNDQGCIYYDIWTKKPKLEIEYPTERTCSEIWIGSEPISHICSIDKDQLEKLLWENNISLPHTGRCLECEININLE